jgi:hypothetical protein
MRNVIDSPFLKAEAERQAGKVVWGITQRGSYNKRQFQVWFDDGSHDYMYLAKQPKRIGPRPRPADVRP